MKLPGNPGVSGCCAFLFFFLTLLQHFFVFSQSDPDRSNIPSCYKTLSEIDAELQLIGQRFPELVSIETIGVSATLGLPIWGVKISDEALLREDEPRILFMGVHHAREPIGANICLALMTRLCQEYERDSNIKNWLNETEIWFIPVVNPDGYKYIFDNNLTFPWWRKNLRDNDEDGNFDPLVDGVDLNRNYDFNWRSGGEDNSESWFYRGESPFSESETIAIKQLTERENFTIGVSYHSYGESVLFPWGNFEAPPDIDLITDIGGKLAAKIKRESGYGRYSMVPLNGSAGQSSIWMYGQRRVIDFIVEVGSNYFPSPKQAENIVSENLKGAYFLLDRLHKSAISASVRDFDTGEPLAATLVVENFEAKHVSPRRADSAFGRIHQLLLPGNYNIRLECEGYRSATLANIRIYANRLTQIDIRLRKLTHAAKADGIN